MLNFKYIFKVGLMILTLLYCLQEGFTSSFVSFNTHESYFSILFLENKRPTTCLTWLIHVILKIKYIIPHNIWNNPIVTSICFKLTSQHSRVYFCLLDCYRIKTLFHCISRIISLAISFPPHPKYILFSGHAYKDKGRPVKSVTGGHVFSYARGVCWLL